MKEWRVPTLYFNCDVLWTKPDAASGWINFLRGSVAPHKEANCTD